mmetsp:Transcript_9917/g.32500  ORF Transcript_9917/g.32500 Transcript_9917/m.32500 type:complete len:219 (+) Transcript_9917:278-934(+)
MTPATMSSGRTASSNPGLARWASRPEASLRSSARVNTGVSVPALARSERMRSSVFRSSASASPESASCDVSSEPGLRIRISVAPAASAANSVSGSVTAPSTILMLSLQATLDDKEDFSPSPTTVTVDPGGTNSSKPCNTDSMREGTLFIAITSTCRGAENVFGSIACSLGKVAAAAKRFCDDDRFGLTRVSFARMINESLSPITSPSFGERLTEPSEW